VPLDLGVRGIRVVNLSVNFRLRPQARNRIATACLTAYLSGVSPGRSPRSPPPAVVAAASPRSL